MISEGAKACWARDCQHYHGHILTGHFSHWCSDWDELPIDETCPEWPCACATTMIEEHNAGVLLDEPACVSVGRVADIERLESADVRGRQ